MRRVMIFAMAMALGAGMCAAQEFEAPDNFKGIKFGSSKDSLIAMLKVNDLLKGEEDIIGDYYIGDDYIHIDEFKLGDKKVEVNFYFFENQFYSFEFQSHGYERTFSTQKYITDYLAEIFKNKYGNWKYQYDRKIYEVDSDATYFTHKWVFPKNTVYIGISGSEGFYTAKAVVYNDALNKLSNEAYEKKKEKEVKNATDDF